MDTIRRLKGDTSHSAAQNSNSSDRPLAGRLNSSPEGIKFVHLLFAYFCFTTTILIIALTFRCYARRRHVAQLKSEAAGETPIHAANHIGMFASARWHFSLRGGTAMFFMLCVIVPNVVMCVCFLLGAFLAAVESWELVLGLEYMLSTVLGLSVPLTSASPVTTFGIGVDYVASIWAMLLITTAMGLAAGMCLITKMADTVPQSKNGFFLVLLGVLPILLIVLTALLGGIMASIEDWSYQNGFYFMIGSVCGLANPLTTVVPNSAEGAFFEVMCVSVEICLGGAIIGIVGAHPLAAHFLLMVEGDDDVQEAEERELDKLETELANGSPNRPKKGDEEDESPLLEEIDALRRQVQALEAKVQAADEKDREKDALLKELHAQVTTDSFANGDVSHTIFGSESVSV